MGFFSRLAENLGERSFDCPHCNLEYTLDADGVKAAQNTTVRRKCGKCGKYFKFTMSDGGTTVHFKD
jgi:predicted Zn finger-like uncharacterized protein